VIEVPAATACAASQFLLITRQGSVDAADHQPSAVPGEVVEISGILVGPAKPAKGTIDSSGKVATSAGGVQVFFDGIPAPILLASAGQTTAVVPFEVVGQYSTNIQVSFNGFLSKIMTVAVGESHSAVFTQDSSGSGAGVILNQDASLNSAGHPAAKGSIVTVYTTGLGLLSPQVADGVIAGALSAQAETITATVGGEPAEVAYAGTAPGLAAGVSQVKVRIPEAAPSGNVSIVIQVGQAPWATSSSANVTVTVE
jgi:uncharacterized protein (TIGR03437 family)